MSFSPRKPSGGKKPGHKPYPWTEELLSAMVHRHKVLGESLRSIADSLGVPRRTLSGKYGRMFGDSAHDYRVKTAPDAGNESFFLPNEELREGAASMPPGHPVSWQAITKGTLLEGCRYPKGGSS